jgi:hypothetical protein
LPPVTGGTAAQANALNNLGHAVGYSVVGGISHATLWIDGVATDLGANTSANGINDSDQIVGYRNDGSGYPHAHFWPDDIDLPALTDFDSSVATGINNLGEVVGIAFTLQNPSLQNGFSWRQAGVIQAISNCASADAVNDAGQIAGILENLHAGICEADVDFGHIGAADAINSSGTAVGYDVNGAGWRFPNFNLGPTLATGINDSGWIVGDTITPLRGSTPSVSRSLRSNIVGTSQPWFWSDQTGFVNLGINTAQAINQTGQIAGDHILPDGSTHGALLNPQ